MIFVTLNLVNVITGAVVVYVTLVTPEHFVIAGGVLVLIDVVYTLFVVSETGKGREARTRERMELTG